MSKISNSYFNSIIKEYVDKTNYDNIMDLCDVDIRKKELCMDSKISSQISNIDYFSNKRKQYESLIKYLGKKPEYLPETIMFNKDNIEELKKYFYKNNKNKYNNNKWIVKPENSLARKGVMVFNNYSKIEEHVLKSKYYEWIFQEYIENPLLIDGKKFHFRLYVIILKTKKRLKIYIYDKGFMYFSKKEYNKNIIDQDTHLSGESNKNHVKVYPDDFLKHYSINIYDKILQQFKKIAKETVMANYEHIECINSDVEDYKCFKFLGYDILIDTDF